MTIEEMMTIKVNIIAAVAAVAAVIAAVCTLFIIVLQELRACKQRRPKLKFDFHGPINLIPKKGKLSNGTVK